MTANKSKLVLFNLKDAISTLPADLGIQVHRSYWVVLNHVVDIKSQQGQHWVVMPGEILLPVSRRNWKNVRLAFNNHQEKANRLN